VTIPWIQHRTRTRALDLLRVYAERGEAEAGHLIILVLIGGITVWAAAHGWWDTVPWLRAFNILHNGYPVLSMRQFRARLEHSKP
jgi:hypothetical protein